MKAESIFVQIASFRDDDLPTTVCDLFEKALYPQQIYVGICLQGDTQELEYVLAETMAFADRTEIDFIPYSASLGACWARARAMRVINGQSHVLQVDSHMRFAIGWDVKLLDYIAHAPSGKPFLSTYPSGFIGARHHGLSKPNRVVARGFDRRGFLQFDGVEILDVWSTPLVRGMFCGGCFIFGPSALFRECPPISGIALEQEEETLAVRLFRSGWDLFHPNEHIVFHRWDRNTKRVNNSASACDRAYVGHLETTDQSQKQGEAVRVAHKRTLYEFEKMSGVSFEERLVSRQALRGEFH